jgi:hypothetical protein
MLYALGPVVFTVAPLNADKIGREGETRHAQHAVMGAAPVYEFMGEGQREFTIKGAVFPEHFGGLGELETIEALRRAGMPQHLIRGDGKPIGWVLIQKVKEDGDHLGFSGVPRHISYSIDMKITDAPSGAGLIDVVGGFLR